MKQLLKQTITNVRPLLRMINMFAGQFPKVLVYHRFTPEGENVPHRVSADQFGWQLDQIRKDFQVLTLQECINHYRDKGRWPGNAVIITVDDGYRDFYEYAFPELRARKMRATFFVTANFIDQKIWLWPDRLYYLLSCTKKDRVRVRMATGEQSLSLVNENEKSAAWGMMNAWCISLPDLDKDIFMSELELKLDVSTPVIPTSEYAAMNWDELREIHSSGIEIGSHTMNHPILSKIPAETLNDEIFGSKRMLEEKVFCSVATFCYPNSGPGDINDRVVDNVKDAGYSGAVFGIDLKSWDPYRVPRMGVSADRTDFLWKLYGGEALA